MYGTRILVQQQKPTFSILIPTSGRAQLIRMAVQSVLHQTCGDFEIVIADLGGSPDARHAATDSGDPRIRYFHTPGQGLATWDIAAKEASGEYVLWLDDDNYLLPFALDLFKDAIQKSGAEIITASHFYYYDNHQPRRFLRQSLGVLPFTGKESAIDLSRALRELYAFSRRGPGSGLPRFHFSATVISRPVIRRVLDRLGFVLLGDMPNIHSLQPILFPFAKTCLFVDCPVVIVGRLGVSMSQIWSTAARRRFSQTPFRPTLSPVIGYTRINGILENYLRVQRLLPDLLDTFSINYERFAERYLRELSFLDTDLITAARFWKNLFSFLKTLPPPSRRRLSREAGWRMAGVPLIFLARRTKLHHVWRIIYGALVRRRERKIPSTQKFRGTKEFTIPLDPNYRIGSIADLAACLPEIVRKEIGIDLPH